MTFEENAQVDNGARIVLYIRSKATNEVISIILKDQQTIVVDEAVADTYTLSVGSQMHYTSQISINGVLSNQLNLTEDTVIEVTKTKSADRWMSSSVGTY